MNEYVRLSYQEEEKIKLRLYKEFEDQKKKELSGIEYKILTARRLQEFIHEQKDYVERGFTKYKSQNKK